MPFLQNHIFMKNHVAYLLKYYEVLRSGQ